MPESSLQASAAEETELRDQAVRAVRACSWLPDQRRSTKPRQTFRASARRLSELEAALYELRSGEPSEDLRWLYDNLRLVRTDLHGLSDALKSLAKLPLVRTPVEESIPRCLVLSRALLAAAGNRLTDTNISLFLSAVQDIEPLGYFELAGMIPALKLALVEVLADRGWQALEAFQARGPDAEPYGVGDLITSLRLLGEIDWKEPLEQLSVVHRILLGDPGRVYSRMDFESRDIYRRQIAKIAARSDLREADLAELAIDMAGQAANRMAQHPSSAQLPEPLRDRMRHVGYYFMDQTGSRDLLNRAGYRPSIGTRLESMLRRNPDEVYIIGIEAITLVTVVALIMSIVRTHSAPGLILSALFLLLPASQAAVELMNYLVTSILTPRALPKLDFTDGIDADCATMVAIPTLLLNQKQIRTLVDHLEVRYLVNRDPNIFFALLTDLPDSPEPAVEQDARVDFTIGLIEDLNGRYGREPYGGFYLFHRHRLFNPRERAWMGWERKRGKLLDLNKLLRNASNPFPVKTGNMSRLPPIRYVLTLDSDTQLPRGAAHRLIGAMAHPLNRPLIDPDLNIVNDGYGILQPRVEISVHSSTRSRLAGIYSGQTGFDIYSRAVSDVYQDLYSEGIFTGKGIYDIDAFQRVLEHRFPRNALLSHDLIEGAYARAGLVSDIEVVDDYPSHYRAYNRRKHRWLRGDWQITRWIFNRVPNESGVIVENPIALVSRWKIVDNLRRSLVEPATVGLLIAGWYLLPGGPRFWTFVTLALLFLPIYFRLLFSLARAAVTQVGAVAREALSDFVASHAGILLNIAFLAHQALVAVDAIVRTVVRATITHSRLLEWETAMEAELTGGGRRPVDVYLDWIPIFCLLVGLPLLKRPEAAPYALPFLVAWCLSKPISEWMNRSPHDDQARISQNDTRFLRHVALRTWRYFAEFSNERNHWLIPDNVQEEPYRIAERSSPTNLGFLLNARQAALELGYLTVSEFVAQTQSTLQSLTGLQREFGHFLNWYDNIGRAPLGPRFVSSVDSANLAASLWALKHCCLEALNRPVLRRSILDALLDFECIVHGKHHRGPLSKIGKSQDPSAWVRDALAAVQLSSDRGGKGWWGAETARRIEAFEDEIRAFMPWALAQFAELRIKAAIPAPGSETVTYDEVERQLDAMGVEGAEQLRREIAGCRERVQKLATNLKHLAAECDRLVRQMDFNAVVSKRRKLLSVGYDVEAGELAKSCYDLLASESRTAAFIAISKGDAVQEIWFRLGRQHTVCEGETALISWTGTMFEYLMPVIWMRSYPDTLLDRTVRAAVRAQQKYATSRGVPWGISEAAYAKRDEEGNYQYAAFGVPGLALNVARAGSLVTSPYSSCLSLGVDPRASIQNLRRMQRQKWLTDYGFYESIDFTVSQHRTFGRRKGEVIRCWMAHHQGMTMTAICNLLCDQPFQRWFHSEPLVQASELILQERPLRARPITDRQPRRVVAFPRRAAKSGPAAKARAPA